MKLNGWIRLGIVLSVVWVGVVFAVVGVELFGGAPEFFFSRVITKTGESVTPDMRNNAFYDLIPTHCVFRFPAFAGVMFLPLAAAWIVVSAIVWALRWIRAGFTHGDDAAALTMRRSEPGHRAPAAIGRPSGPSR